MDRSIDFALVEDKDTKCRLIIVLHHLTIGWLSFRWLSQELANYYNNETYKSSISVEEQLLLMKNLSLDLSLQVKLTKRRE